jgi:hypothetical protein
MSFLILHGGVVAYSVQYIECVHVVSHSLIVSFAFALVQLVGQIDAGKPFAKDFGFGWRSLATEPRHTRSSRNRLFLTVLQKEAKRGDASTRGPLKPFQILGTVETTQ